MTIHEQTTVAPYEQARVVQRARLADDGPIRFSARRDGTRVLVRLERVALCRDDVLVSRGLVVTTHRPLPTAFKIAGWATFGTFAALTVASALAYQSKHCQAEDPICLSKGLDYVGLVTAGTGAALSGSFLFVNYMNAIDSSEELEQSKSAERRVQPCGQMPWKGATVEAAADGVRASAPTNDDGEAVLELGLRQDASQEVAVQFALDGALLGPLPLSSPWRSGLLHK